jgi:DHA1 family bicyclomycin/chloramphenicol resistance-like MFS transporter
MSQGLTGLGVIACIAAPLGGLLSDLAGWRVALLAVAVFGAGTFTVIALRFTETVPPANRRAMHPVLLAKTWVQILRNPTFLAFSALSAASYGGLFTFLASSSFVFIRVLGLSKTQYGFLMFTMSLSYIAGTFLCRRLLVRWGVRRTLAVAGGLTLTAGTTMALLATFGAQSSWYGPWAIMLPFYLFMIAHGVHQPCGQSGAVGPFPMAAGTASAVNGFIMMIAAFFMGGWLGTHMDGTVFPLVHGVLFWSALIALSAWTLVQKYGQSQTH